MSPRKVSKVDKDAYFANGFPQVNGAEQMLWSHEEMCTTGPLAV